METDKNEGLEWKRKVRNRAYEFFRERYDRERFYSGDILMLELELERMNIIKLPHWREMLSEKVLSFWYSGGLKAKV